MVWEEKELEKINTEYSFNNLDFTKLNKDNIYLIKVKLSNWFSNEDVVKYCQGLKEVLNARGINNCIICPIQENAVDLELYKLEADLELYKLEKSNKDLKQ